MKKKMELAENPKFLQFIEQDFQVIEKKYDTWTYRRIQVVGFCNPKETFECSSFRVEVVKDYDGFITFIVMSEGIPVNDPYANARDVRIMRTDDFNCAYDLKNQLDTLLGDYVPNEKQKMNCYGNLQREKTMWER